MNKIRSRSRNPAYKTQKPLGTPTSCGKVNRVRVSWGPMRRAMVTGGAGFIGSNLALELETLGLEVVVADENLGPALKNLKGFKGKIIPLDVAQGFSFPEKFDVVFHQAAITDPRYPNSEELMAKNIKGFENVLNFCLKTDTRLVYASTAGLYGNGALPMKEENGNEAITPYGKSKWHADKLAQTYFNKLPIIGLRYFNVYGPREAHKGKPASMIYHLYQQIKKGGPVRLFKHGEQTRDFVYVKDAVAANICALKSESGIFNVGSGVQTTFNELVQTLFMAMAEEVPVEYFEMPFDPVTYQHRTQADLDLARRELKFEPIWDLKKGSTDYFQWLEKESRNEKSR